MEGESLRTGRNHWADFPLCSIPPSILPPQCCARLNDSVGGSVCVKCVVCACVCNQVEISKAMSDTYRGWAVSKWTVGEFK